MCMLAGKGVIYNKSDKHKVENYLDNVFVVHQFNLESLEL